MRFGETTSSKVESVATAIVDAIFRVYQRLGPGLLESVYEACLACELTRRGLRVEKQVAVPAVYDEVTLDVGFRLDLLVEDCVIVELKAIEKLVPLHEAQILSYLKLSGKRLAILVNFNASFLKDPLKRVIM